MAIAVGRAAACGDACLAPLASSDQAPVDFDIIPGHACNREPLLEASAHPRESPPVSPGRYQPRKLSPEDAREIDESSLRERALFCEPLLRAPQSLPVLALGRMRERRKQAESS